MPISLNQIKIGLSTDYNESSGKLPHALLITQISKEDYIDFPDFSMNLISV
jgi:hypothetical protein